MFNPIGAELEARRLAKAARRASFLGDNALSQELHLKAAHKYAQISAWASKAALICAVIAALLQLYSLLF